MIMVLVAGKSDIVGIHFWSCKRMCKFINQVDTLSSISVVRIHIYWSCKCMCKCKNQADSKHSVASTSAIVGINIAFGLLSVCINVKI